MVINETTIDVRYAETDQMGVVYHANYVIWMEVGRTKFIEQLGYKYADLEKEGYLSPVLNIHVDYKTPVRYGQTVTVRTWVQAHSRVRTTYGYEIVHEDGTVAVTGQSTHTIVKKDTFRPVAFSKIAPEWDALYHEIKAEK
ncbi:MAG: thioesterase family protein [Caryophanon sp.]|nr:thioesterase family protein [Caryophanon sp.]